MNLSGYQYTCAGGETFDSIARDIYKDEKYASELMCANPEYCNMFVFAGGENILLPTIDISADEEQTSVKAPWKE